MNDKFILKKTDKKSTIFNYFICKFNMSIKNFALIEKMLKNKNKWLHAVLLKK